MKITFLHQSSFVVETEKHTLIFDYYNDKPAGGFSVGTVMKEDIENKNVVVFASHQHHDHFDPCIFVWREWNAEIRYVLSSDIETTEEAFVMKPNESLDLGDLQIETLRSTDLGVAFLITVDGTTIYHAGDLNWWHWEGEPGDWNEQVEKAYCNEIETIRGREFDLAFVPVDPRLKNQATWGIDFFMEATNTAHVFPMHIWEDASVFEKLENKPYESRLYLLSQRGQAVEVAE